MWSEDVFHSAKLFPFVKCYEIDTIKRLSDTTCERIYFKLDFCSAVKFSSLKFFYLPTAAK